MSAITSPVPLVAKPIDFSGDLQPFGQGVLCFVVARRYKGKGPVKLILHEASVWADHDARKSGFGYGAERHWVVSPGALLGRARSKAKSAAARANGRKGGRPKCAK